MAGNLLTCRWTNDTKGLSLLERLVPSRADDYTKEMAEDTQQYVRDNWSGHSPSSPGNPPAMVSGALDESIGVQEVSGLFGGKKGHAVVVGEKYGPFLEKGTRKMEARPFLLPAAMDVFSRNGKEKAKAVFKVK